MARVAKAQEREDPAVQVAARLLDRAQEMRSVQEADQVVEPPQAAPEVALVPEEWAQVPPVAPERRAAGRAVVLTLPGLRMRLGLGQLAARAMLHQAALVVALEPVRGTQLPAAHLELALAAEHLVAKALTLEQDPAAK